MAIVAPVLLAGRGRGVLDRIVLETGVAVAPVVIIAVIIAVVPVISVVAVVAVVVIVAVVPAIITSITSIITIVSAVAAVATAAKSTATAAEPAAAKASEPTVLPPRERAGKGRAPLEDRGVSRRHGAEDGEENVLRKHLD